MRTVNFSLWLRETRIEKGLTSKELAEKAGLTEVTLSRYENKRRVPNLNSIVALVDALGASMSDLDAYSTDDEQIEDSSVEEDGLKPCPFCGSKAVLRERFRTSKEVKEGVPAYYWVECFDGECCGGETVGSESKEEAIGFWNKRRRA